MHTCRAEIRRVYTFRKQKRDVTTVGVCHIMTWLAGKKEDNATRQPQGTSTKKLCHNLLQRHEWSSGAPSMNSVNLDLGGLWGALPNGTWDQTSVFYISQWPT
mmetsp:Transcript_159491/g.290949  ORF Transcript_159491/g.290949 Transcript_159491/m.290949 type:complete len:103 (-) Transcript_159491:1491-1799(-)